MVNLELLRNRQEQRLLPALEAWDLAKRNLQEAIALAETREREFREVSEDVKRRVAALELVGGMAREIEAPAPMEHALPAAVQPRLAPPPEPIAESAEEAPASSLVKGALPDSQRADFPIRRSWRPLFSTALRSRAADLSIRS